MHKALLQAVAKGGDCVSFNRRRALSSFSLFAPLTRYSINVRQRVGRSKHVLMKKEGSHLARVRCLDCKILQCPGDLEGACPTITPGTYVAILNSRV